MSCRLLKGRSITTETQGDLGPGDPQERNATAVILTSTIRPFCSGTSGTPGTTRAIRTDSPIKFGGWRHFASFADQWRGSNGVSFAACQRREPLLMSRDLGSRAVFKQQIDPVPHNDDRGIARVAGGGADRNAIDLYAGPRARRFARQPS